MHEYQPVTVDAARQIGLHFAKGVVVIVAIDLAYDLIHCTTWGASAAEKYRAAELGDLLAKTAGGDLARKTGFEDFRTRPPAEAAATIDRLTQERDRLAAELNELRSRVAAPGQVAPDNPAGGPG